VYQYYKAKEKAYLENADYVISLTQAGKRELRTWPFFSENTPLQVIPCCADMELFSVTDAAQKKKSRELLGIPQEALVFSYLGSVGLWYMLPEMLRFFKQVKETYPDALFLFVTPTPTAVILNKATEAGVPHSSIIIKEAARMEVPNMIKASDINISFIKPVYSKVSSSPTKLGEVLAMGIPVISNSGVGDVAEIVEGASAGYIIDNFSPDDFDRAIEAIPLLLKKSALQIREAIAPLYSLDEGIGLYAGCYKEVLQ
jgi:glycosyltransferase involved in cell wall biosynthesis